MTKSFLNSTTALVVSATLAMPMPVLAQDAAPAVACVDAEGKPWNQLPQRGAEHKEARKAAKQKDKNPLVALTGQTGECLVLDGQTQLVVEGTVTETGAVYASFKQVMIAVKSASEANGEAAAEGNAGAQAAADQPSDAATAEAQVEGESATDSQVEAKADALANELAEAEAQAEADVAVETAAGVDTGTGSETDAGGEAEAAASDETKQAEEESEAVETEAEDSNPETAEASGSATAESDVTADADTPEVQQEDTAESTADANETVTAEAATTTEDDSTAKAEKVEKRKIRQEQIRKSNQEFANAVAAQAAAAASNNDDGLSDFEKFAIGALGIAAVGTLLKNGDKVVSNSGDRVVVQRQDGNYEVLKDDNVLLRQPGVEIETERFSDGSTRETVYREDGTRVVTIKAANGQVLRRARVLEDGTQILLFDDTGNIEPVQVTELPKQRESSIDVSDISSDELRMALAAQEQSAVDRRFSLQQIRQIRAVRELVPVIELDEVTFDTGSAAIRASEAEELRDLGLAMKRLIEENPYEIFLVEGHTDAVGNATFNLALSDRRAESVALALTEYFDVPPENMVVQGYGESNLKILTPLAERENRRATVRRITNLLRTASMQ